jgi:hypothetical protein
MNASRLFVTMLMACVFLVQGNALGQSGTGLCGGKDTTVYFGNGILTSFSEANRDLEDLKRSLQTIMSQEDFDKLDFNLAINHTGGTLADLLESTIQSLQNDYARFWRILAGLEAMPDFFSDKLLELAAASDRDALLSNSDLGTQVASYKNSILEGKKVIVFSHSQGNFFANQAYRNMSTQERPSFGIVSIANPDTEVATVGPYTTLVEDLVIQAVRAVKVIFNLPAPLPANLSNFAIPNVWHGHSFSKVYLSSGSNSRAKILNDFINVKSGLTPPLSAAGQGIITVTLTWGAQPDVDLHVFEPDGGHVYYANLVGTAGYLDHDDVTSYGPEHYFVACDTLQSGTYRVGVNYYYGSSPETANVLIQAGLESRGFSVFLPTALQSSGNASPMPVANIVVTGDSTDGYSFEIQ